MAWKDVMEKNCCELMYTKVLTYVLLIVRLSLGEQNSTSVFDSSLVKQKIVQSNLIAGGWRQRNSHWKKVGIHNWTLKHFTGECDGFSIHLSLHIKTSQFFRPSDVDVLTGYSWKMFYLTLISLQNYIFGNELNYMLAKYRLLFNFWQSFQKYFNFLGFGFFVCFTNILNLS